MKEEFRGAVVLESVEHHHKNIFLIFLTFPRKLFKYE